MPEYESEPHPEYVHDDGLRYSIDTEGVVYASDGDELCAREIGRASSTEKGWIGWSAESGETINGPTRRAVLLALIARASHSR